MLRRRFYDEKLAHASYLVACQATGEALILDPARDVEPYLMTAAAENLKVVGVTETHIHADFASGTRELGARTAREWEGGHVRGAIHIPLGHLPARLGELEGQSPLAVHCQSGVRSAMAVSVLRKAGHEVYDLGAFPAWKEAGLPVDQLEPSPV